MPGLAIDYRPGVPLTGKSKHPPAATTLYLAFSSDAEWTMVLADVAIEATVIST